MPLRLPARRGNKFGAVKTVVDGIRFDSKRKAHRYSELKLLERAGEVRRFIPQPSFRLLAFGRGAVAGPQVFGFYTADFEVEWASGEITIEDVKSPATAKRTDYRMRKKLFEICHWPLVVTEV
jgi:hypothetical protein